MYSEKIKKLIGKNILIFGDFMVDRYINGDVKRISPEAPIPVLSATKITDRLGGAGNVANNVIALGSNPVILSRIGNDTHGKDLYSKLKDIGCNVENLFLYDGYTTTCKTRVVSKNQQFIRIDEEVVEKNPKEFFDAIKERIESIFSGIDAVIISDYDKGVVNKDVSTLLIDYARQKDIPVVVDPKGSDYSKYTKATVCTPNMNEMRIVCGKQINSDEEILTFGGKLQKELELDYLLVTRSEKGLSLIKDNKKDDFPVLPKEVIDVTGAGDTVVAIMAIGLASGIDMQNCCILANQAASVVISKFGASTVTIEELMEINNKLSVNKIVRRNNVSEISKMLKKENKKIVFTNGCFDLLHSGHLLSLQTARSFGDVLVVGLNSDSSIKRIKGENRPIIDEINRANMLAGLESVDYLVIFDEDTPQSLIESLVPDILVKGADWKGTTIAGEEFTVAHGGHVEYIDLKEGFSTTKIIEKIKNT